MAKRNRRISESGRKSKRAFWTARRDPLSEKWYTLKQACKMLDISISASKIYRKRGMLIISKRLGKIYVNEYHYQKFLRDGLPGVISLMTLVNQFSGACDVLLSA